MGIYHDPELPDRVRLSRLAALRTLIALYAPSFVALQEAPDDLGRGDLGPRYRVISGLGGITTAVLQTAWRVRDHSTMEGWRALVVKVDPLAGGLDLWLWNLHQPILHKDSEERRTLSRCEPRDDLRRFRARDPDRGELVVGDFNLEPHDVAMVGRDGFYARSSPEWVLSRPSRRDILYRPLYNATPTPSASQRDDPPYGSYYRDKSKDGAGPWFRPDQVLMSAELLRCGKPRVTLLPRAGETDLCAPAHRRPDPKVGSDHLPLLIELMA
ncbi:hypothetical protein BE20_35765 [Sorangium cellulosum]|uniref:Endonuclease/exonuclease/phosphatase domain-containing protein n=1 Tax=Sorangium cellulosum TaxID=56 RepID=A0A150T8F4_SORCE|nr:hypothetical protein BE20_35765 [Sorangium cellulosum]KYG00954.1 hypothetical protein BE18_38540 [Sorangium cellulosum]